MPKIILPEPTKESFEFQGSKPAIQFIHGFTGTPYEIRPLARHIHDQTGRHCLGQILAGHGLDAQYLNTVTHSDWVIQNAMELASLSHDGPVDVVGFSMGGLVATHLAALYPHLVRRLVLLAPAFHLKFLPSAGVFLARAGVKHWLPQVPKLGTCDVADIEARQKNPTLKHIPSHALLELDRLRKEVLTEVSQVSCPTLVVWGAADKTVHNRKGAKVADKIRNKPKSHTLQNSRHILALDNDRDELAELVTNFLQIEKNP